MTNRIGAGMVAIALVLPAGCMQNRRPAPVVERGPAAVKPAVPPKPEAAEADKAGSYTVRKGDTLYSVAAERNIDYRDLAEWNGIDPNLPIRIGQQLRLTPPAGAAATAPLKTPPVAPGPPPSAPPESSAAAIPVKTQPKAIKQPYSDQALARLLMPPDTSKPALPPELPPAGKPPIESDPEIAETDEERIEWGWPAVGKVVSGFDESANLKGIDIAGKLGQPVIASAAGRVIYSGTGPRGYGKLVIIRHNKNFLSAYAHNSEIVVKEEQTVSKGQKIAEMGSSDTDQVKLHFEIRRLGKPVDPVRYLPGGKS